MATPTNSMAQQGRQIAVALGEHAQDVVHSVDGRLQRMVQQGADDMRRRAPKFQTTLTNSIHTARVGEAHHRIEAGVAHAAAVDQGRKPGKGLPRFFDLAAGGLVAWLESKRALHMAAFAGPFARGKRPVRKPKRGSARFTAQELDLRDRYMALSRAVKFKGIKAQPFFTPVAQRLERDAPQLLAEEVQACMARAAQLARGQRGGVVRSTA